MVTIDEYLQSHVKDKIDYNIYKFLQEKEFAFSYLNIYLDIYNKKVFYILYGQDNKKNIIYKGFISKNNLDTFKEIKSLFFYQPLTREYYLEWNDSKCSCLSLVTFVKEDSIYKKIYIIRYNFGILPTVKYMLRKFDREPEVLKPLLVIRASKFIEFYKNYYDNIIILKSIIKGDL